MLMTNAQPAALINGGDSDWRGRGTASVRARGRQTGGEPDKLVEAVRWADRQAGRQSDTDRQTDIQAQLDMDCVCDAQMPVCEIEV